MNPPKPRDVPEVGSPPFGFEGGGDRGLGHLLALGGSVDAFGPSVIQIETRYYGPPFEVERP